jgi:hypothetical protein
MSNQVYRNDQDSKYSPSKIVNRMEIQGVPQTIAAAYTAGSVSWNKVNGVNATVTAGIIDYLPLIIPGSDDIIPVYNNSIKLYTYFKVMKSATYTISVVVAMNGATVVNEMRGIGIAVCDKGTLTPQNALRGLQCQWGPSSGVVNPGPWCISAQYTGYLEAGQTFFPGMISSNGITVINDLSTHGQVTLLEYFKN